MAATRRIYERRSESGGLTADRFAFCEIKLRTGPLSLAFGKWKVIITDKPAPTGAEYPAQSALIRDIFGNPFRPIAVDPSWLTSTVVALAEGIYAERAIDRMPILADALMDAGCANEDILNHLRSAGPHVRGCWALDLILGKG